MEAAIVFVTMAAGYRVHVPHPPKSFSDLGAIVPLIDRNPDRLPPPELANEEPTKLEPDADRQEIIIDPAPPASQFRASWAVWQLLRYLAALLRLKLTGRLDDEKRAVMTRQLFERMSGIWIKVGQLLSLRGDLISKPMARELSTLQYQARGFPTELARQVIEAELGRPVGAVFAWFETAPFAAATIAQVHRATLLRNNRAVVVKVMRPDVDRSFERDLGVLEFMVTWMLRLGIGKRFRMREGLREMRAILTEETNFLYEAVNLKRMRKNLKKHDIYVPRVIETLSHPRMLVMEEVPGVLMSQYLTVRQTDPDRARRWAVLNGIEDKTLARRLCVTVLRQILEDNEFHGDLHPGNIMLLADNRIALIDFGSVGRLAQNTWTLYRLSLQALAMKDYVRAADLMLLMSPSPSAANTRQLRLDMTAALRSWAFESEFPSSSYADRSIAGMSDKISVVMATHNVPLSWGIMRVGRSLSTLDASLQALVPDANFMTLCRAYYKDYQRRLNTFEGRRAAFRSAVVKLSTFTSDAELLLGSTIRDQALRLNGVLDRLTLVRLTALAFLQRGLLLLIVLLCEAFIFDQFFSNHVNSHHFHFLPDRLVQFGSRALPGIHPIWWCLMIGVAVYLFRLLQAVRKSIARLE